MPTLIKVLGGVYLSVEDQFLTLGEDDGVPAQSGVILELPRFLTEGAALLDEDRCVGVLIQPDHRVEDLEDHLPRLALVAMAFPKFRDGRPYSSAALLRERFLFKGEVRAVGDVGREQAFEMVRCGFDAFVATDGSTAEIWAKSAGRFRHVYQAAADGRAPAFAERRG